MARAVPIRLHSLCFLSLWQTRTKHVAVAEMNARLRPIPSLLFCQPGVSIGGVTITVQDHTVIPTAHIDSTRPILFQ